MQFHDRGIMIAVILIVLVGGIVFTLWWWKLADRWANAEHRRFRRQGLRPGGGAEESRTVVIRPFDKPPSGPGA